LFLLFYAVGDLSTLARKEATGQASAYFGSEYSGGSYVEALRLLERTVERLRIDGGECNTGAAVDHS
jgi:hypothetical protein